MEASKKIPSSTQYNVGLSWKTNNGIFKKSKKITQM